MTANKPTRSFSASAPASEPVTTAEAKAHLRVSGNDEDTYVDALVTAARQWTEFYLGRLCMTQTITEKWDWFPVGCAMSLRWSPVQSFSSVGYLDSNGDTQTWDSADYTVDTTTQPGRVAPKYGEQYPETRSQQNAVTLTYVAGYASADLVPKAIKQAILLMVGEMYEQRENTVKQLPTAAEYLLQPYRIEGF